MAGVTDAGSRTAERTVQFRRWPARRWRVTVEPQCMAGPRMLEYIFFHRELMDEFRSGLDTLAVRHESRDDDLGFVVAVAEDLDEALLDQLDELYETLLVKSEDLLSADESLTDKQAAAIGINLSDGRTVQASVRPALMNKLLEAISFEELNELVEAITDAVENPDERPFCQR